MATLTNEQIINLEYGLDKTDPFYPQAKLVWMAMQDWPSALEDGDELLHALKGELQTHDLTRENLCAYLNQLDGKFGISGNGWRAETVSELLELLDFYPNAKTLDDALNLFSQNALIKIQKLPRE